MEIHRWYKMGFSITINPKEIPPWNVNEPNKYSNDVPGEDYAHIWGSNGLWNDHNCKEKTSNFFHYVDTQNLHKLYMIYHGINEYHSDVNVLD